MNMDFIQCPFCNCEYRVDKEIAGNTIKCQKCEKSFEAKHIYQKKRTPSFEELALSYALISQEQLNEAISIKKAEEQLGNVVSIEDIVLQKRMIQSEQVEMLKGISQFLEMRSLDKKFGKIAISKGFLGEKEVNLALSVQTVNFKKKKYCRLIGDILVESGVLNENQRDSILKEQKRIDSFLPNENNEKPSPKPTDGSMKGSIRSILKEVGEVNYHQLIVTFTQKRALIVIFSILLLTIGLIIYATTVKPNNFRSSVEKSFIDKIFETDQKHYLYPLTYSTTLADQAFFSIEMEIEFNDINGFDEFDRQGERIRHAFNLVFTPRTSQQIKGEKKIHTTLKKIINSQVKTHITNIYVSKYMLTSPDGSETDQNTLHDNAMKLFK